MSGILITGAAGYLGSMTCQHLAAAGHEVVGLDNLYNSHAHALQCSQNYQGDVQNKPLLRQIMQAHPIHTVIHLAGLSNVAESVQHPLRYEQQNVGGLRNVLEVMAEMGITQCIFASSAAVYGEASQTSIAETCPLLPITPYGKSKMACESLLHQAASTQNICYASLRFFNIAGATKTCGEARKDETHLMPLLAQSLWQTEGRFTLYGIHHYTQDGTAMRDYVHVSDAARACLHALDYLQTGGHALTCNIGTGQGISVAQTVASARRLCQYPDYADLSLKIRKEPRREGDPSHLVANIDRATHLLNWQPTPHTAEALLKSTVDWQLQGLLS